MNAVEIRDLVKEYPVHRGLRESIRHPFARPTKRVLDGVSLTARQGEVLGILGSNGAGKTTLLKIVGTLVAPTEGSVSVLGWDVGLEANEAKREVAYAFADERSFYWRLTGRQNLEFFAALNDVHGSPARRRIEELAEQLGIARYLEQPYSFYSTGIRQRFSLARALLHRPSVLLLDEPTRSIDPAEARQVWSLIKGTLVGEEGMTVLVVTHQPEEAIAVCDQVGILDRGSLWTELCPADLRRASEGLHGWTLAIEGFRPVEVSRLRSVRGVREVSLSESDGEQQLEIWCDNGDLALSDLVAATTATGARVRGLSPSAPVSEVVARLIGRGGR